jgi:hypothetical protein
LLKVRFLLASPLPLLSTPVHTLCEISHFGIRSGIPPEDPARASLWEAGAAMRKLLLATAITFGLFGALARAFSDSPGTISDAMIIGPRGSIADALTARNG